MTEINGILDKNLYVNIFKKVRENICTGGWTDIEIAALLKAACCCLLLRSNAFLYSKV